MRFTHGCVYVVYFIPFTKYTALPETLEIQPIKKPRTWSLKGAFYRSRKRECIELGGEDKGRERAGVRRRAPKTTRALALAITTAAGVVVVR